MNRIDSISQTKIPNGKQGMNRKFWMISFLVYSAAEALYSVFSFIITLEMCPDCAASWLYYLILWTLSLLFTAGLWYFLNRFYFQPLWIRILVNVLAFTTHYFLWLMMLYGLHHLDQDWLKIRSIRQDRFSDFVYFSWFDIGKYVLKLSAFYALKFYVEYRRSEQQRTELALLNKDLQLNLLKQQLSPHFYFNTLNNLYGLARSNSSRLPEALHQLSNIMQYVIIDCNESKVLLSQEVKFLQSYIALEKLRYEQNTVIEMEVSGYINGQSILPLLLIQFVENAFKHGMKEKSEQNWMKVKMNVEGNDLVFHVDNSYYEAGFSGGIGIASVEHRLDLLYDGKYNMQMQHERNSFSVTLKLNLS